MIVLDQTEEPQAVLEEVLVWRGYTESINVTSIPRYLETHAERLRARYIAFVHDMGQSAVAGKRLIDHLRNRDAFSFWWMTKLAEKSPFKSGRVFACLRMLALEEMLVQARPSDLTLHSGDAVLAQAIGRLCDGIGIRFEWRRTPSCEMRSPARRLYESLPYWLRGLISLRHLGLRWPLRNLKKPHWHAGPDALFLCSNFAHLDAAACARGQFHSHQWEALPKHMSDMNMRANWIHHFLHRPSDVDADTGSNWIRLFNRNPGQQGNHLYLESYLSWGVVWRALTMWLWLISVGWRLRNLGRTLAPSSPVAWLWPLLKADWEDSLTGPTAVSNCFWVELFDRALVDLPRQQLGLYLWENQAWECALIHAWRKNGHGKIVGVPHSTTPFWYLNIYDDRRDLTPQYCTKPVPDALAVNGPLARNSLAAEGYPVERLIEVEALRFQYLAAFSAIARTKASSGVDGVPAEGQGRHRVLVLGDFTFAQTIKMLGCIEAAERLTRHKLSISLKAHPTCSIGAHDFPALQFALTDRPLPEILRSFDFAFCSNSTSAVVDALLAGLPVAVFLDNDDFNHSPLRGAVNVRFVSSPQELAAALDSGKRKDIPPTVAEFFHLDERLPRWSRLLSGGAGLKETIGS